MIHKVILTQHLYDGKWAYEIHLGHSCIYTPAESYDSRTDALWSAEEVVSALANSCRELQFGDRPASDVDGTAD
jgi:hypothetical protein